MITRNRQAIGSQIGKSVLIEEDVIEILEGIQNKKYTSISYIAWLYTVNWQTIRNILEGKNWIHITKNFDLEQLKTMLVNGKSSLTNEKVLEVDVLLKSGESVKNICSIYNVSQKVIYDIKYHNTHKDVLKQS